MYPSILRATTAQCFLEWPEEALRSVAKKCIGECAIAGDENVRTIPDY
jgi:hypothetical protein